MISNNLVIKVYSTGTTEITDPGGELQRAENLQFGKCYPGGLYTTCSFYVARDVVKYWQVSGAQRIAIYNGLLIVWEGEVDDLTSALQQTGQGITVTATGYWGAKLMRRGWRKPWADRRVDEDTWRTWTTHAAASAAARCNIERDARIKFYPRAIWWLPDTYAAVRYTAPIGETVKQLTYDYDFDPAAQLWEMGVYRSTDASTWTLVDTNAISGDTYTTGTTTKITTDTTGSIDVTLATPSRYVELRFYSRDLQSAAEDDSTYAIWDNLVVKTETGAINPTEIAKDLVAHFTFLNSDMSNIASNTLDMIPFVTTGWQSAADILMQAVGTGDASYNQWGVCLLGSDQAASADGKPVVEMAAFPVLTSYDYEIRLGESNVVAPFSASQDFSQIYNYIIVSYQDDYGFEIFVTPADDADLTDTSSVTDYGQRDFVLEMGTSTATIAEISGRRFLTEYKDPLWRLDAPIQVMNWIRDSNGQKIPACQIEPRKRVRVMNYNLDLSGTGLTFRISGADYDDASGIATIQVGPPDELLYQSYTPAIVREAQFVKSGGKLWTPDIESMGALGTGGGGSDGYQGKHAYQLAGYTRAQWVTMTDAQKLAAKKAWWAKRRKKRKNLGSATSG